MEYKKLDFSSYRLHLINTDKFKTVLVKVNFREKIKKENITKRNVLGDLLTYSTKNNETKRLMNIKCQDLYAANVYSVTSRYGNYLNTSFELNILNDKYTEEGNLLKGIEFLKEIIFQPNVVNNEFDKDSLDVIKKITKSDLESLEEDTNRYSMIRLKEIMNNKVSSYRMAGYLDELEKINTKNIYDYYKGLFTNNLIDIIVVGNIDFNEITEIIKKEFNFRVFKNISHNYFLNDSKKTFRKKTIIEKVSTNQSKLAMGFDLIGLSDYERKYPLTLFNIIFGVGPESKLFKEVRENNSLCYYINSSCSRLDKSMYVRAGISNDKMNKVVSLTTKMLNDMKKGKFSDTDIDNAFKLYETSLEELEESIGGIAEDFYLQDLIGNDPVDVRRKKMSKVTKDEIVKVAKKISFNTVYMLEGDAQ